MDDFIDPFLLSPSWSEMNASRRSSWVESSIAQANGLLVDSVGAYERDEKSSSICMIPSSHSVGNISSEDPNKNGHDVNPSALVNVYDISKGILVTENQPQQEEFNRISTFQHTEAHENNFSLPGVTESNSSARAYGLESNVSSSVALPHGALTETCSIRSKGSELTAFPHSLEDSHSMTPVSSMWAPAYSSVPSLLMGQGKLQGLDLQGMENEVDMLTKTCLVDGKFLQDHNNVHDPQAYSFVTEQQMKSNGFQSHQQEQSKLHNIQLPSLASGPQMSLTRPAGINTREQSTEGNNMKHYSHTTSGTQSQSIPANASGCNAAAKPRVRARRGQATDPHSIAERLRREKIAERMKNLQELVPNSNKTDKASMLDEIIEYVKFLQLQVKVLSMSRLGAAGAVVPLITDGQAEASGGLHLSSTVGQGVIDQSESQDNLAFEQEVVKLMESSVTTAMQYLQNKGLCLMPIALASAISSQKGQSAAIPKDMKKSDASHGLTYLNGRDGGSGRVNGAVIKQEQATKHTANLRESKPKN